MNKAILLILFLIYNLSTICQNLVTNPGFDSIIVCPQRELYARGEIYKITPNWYNATKYLFAGVYNTCSTPEETGVPINSRNGVYKKQRSGNGYVGFGTYFPDKTTPWAYLQTKLSEKLEKNVQYYGRYFVSPRVLKTERPRYQDGFGIKFFKTQQYDTTFTGNFYDADIKSDKGVIKDTANWTSISGCYKAKGDEEWLMIGNFLRRDDVQIETEEKPYTRYLNIFYFFEDVGLYKFNPLPDTILLCQGQTKTFNASFLESTYQWSTGKKDSTETITQPGTYSVSATIDGCQLSDTVVVIDPSVWQGFVADTTVCKDAKNIELSVGITGSYAWSTGDTTSSIKITKPDIYTVTVTNICSTYVYTSRVDFEECGCQFYAPNAFSPNDDNINDTYKPHIFCKKRELSSYKLSIFNRQGEMVYFTRNIDDTWDGSFRSQKCDVGVYVWVTEYSYEEKGILKSIIQSGDVNLLK